MFWNYRRAGTYVVKFDVWELSEGNNHVKTNILEGSEANNHIKVDVFEVSEVSESQNTVKQRCYRGLGGQTLCKNQCSAGVRGGARGAAALAPNLLMLGENIFSAEHVVNNDVSRIGLGGFGSLPWTCER